VAISSDGRFAYATAYHGAVSIFARDLATGQLTLADTLKGPRLSASIRFRLSPDEKYAALSNLGASSVVIFKRDAETGKLTKFTEVPKGPDGATLIPVTNDANFSPDDHFLYTASNAGISVFKFEDDTLSLVQNIDGDGSLRGLRPFVISLNGHWLYTVAEKPGNLQAFRRDEASGKLESIQTLVDGQDGIASLNGAFRLAESADGKNIYVAAGRTQGDQAVSSFAVQPDGQMKLLQQFTNGMDGFEEFEGANEITVSLDGKWVFAVTSDSDRLFRFHRDPAAGKLTFISSQQADTFARPGAAGVCVSPDSKFVYVADDKESAIEVFKLP
jgi:6-phosphogluconolactonase (cycloisomerase 2 family)